MQAFDDLRNDIQALIDTATSTIQSLVDQAAHNAAAALPSTSSADTADVFTSQLTELSSKVRAATASLRNQAAAVLANTPAPAPIAEVAGGAPSTDTASTSRGPVGPDSFKSAG